MCCYWSPHLLWGWQVRVDQWINKQDYSHIQKKLFAVFLPDTIHTGRPRVGVGIGLRIGFMAAYPETFLVILEPHAGHDDMSCFFHTRSLYVYLDAFE